MNADFLRRAALALVLLGGATYAADTYEPASHRLTIPALTVGGATYQNTVVLVDHFVSPPAGGLPAAGVDTYDPRTRQLTIPAVTVGAKTYENVVVALKDLVSIGSVSGGDTFDGAHLTLPIATVGNAVYNNARVTVASVLSVGGGLPASGVDSYDPASRALTIPVATDLRSGRIYTNAVVKPGRVVAVSSLANAATVLDQHALVQSGLAVGLVSNALQIQLEVTQVNSSAGTSCQALSGGGALKAGATVGTATLYYDSACTQPFVAADFTVSLMAGGKQEAYTQAVTYYSPRGTLIGTQSLHENFAEVLDGTGTAVAVTINGAGTFTPAQGVRTPVQLGLYCTIPVTSAAIELGCAGGVAQDLPGLGIALGSVTPLTLAFDLATGAGLTFSGSGSTVISGPPGSLQLTVPSTNSIVITGGETSLASYSVTGGAAAFALFPPTPTGWTVSDPVNGLQLQITVVNDTTRNLRLSLTRTSTGTPVASGSLDQSGSGTVTFSDGTVETVTGWTLGGVPVPP
jgi:hypothetical protein